MLQQLLSFESELVLSHKCKWAIIILVKGKLIMVVYYQEEKTASIKKCHIKNVVLYLKIAHRCSEYYEALTGVTAFFIPKFNYFNGFFTVNASMSSF